VWFQAGSELGATVHALEHYSCARMCRRWGATRGESPLLYYNGKGITMEKGIRVISKNEFDRTFCIIMIPYVLLALIVLLR